MPSSLTGGKEDQKRIQWIVFPTNEHVVLGAVAQKIKVAHFRLCHSRKPFVMAYPGEAQAPFVTLLRNALPGSGWFWMPLCER